jgi:hypothetical protein
VRLRRLAAALAAAGAASIAAGIGWVYPPAGLIAGGLEAIGGSYLLAYLGARGATR